MYDINMGGWLCTGGAAVRLSVRISRGGRRRHRWTGGLMGIGQEWFDKVLAGSVIRSRSARSVRARIRRPLVEPVLMIGDIWGVVD